MQQVIVNAFGGTDRLGLVEGPTPEPADGQVRVRVLSIGLNRADLMGREGQYKASTGEPPYTPGIEAGGVIDAVGDGVDASRIGERVVLAPGVPRGVDGPDGGTYRSHIVIDHRLALTAPDAIPDDQLGAVWLAYLTAWGCLAWKDKAFEKRQGTVVGIPAASSSVGLAAAQVAKSLGYTTIGMTSSPAKADALRALETARFDHLVVTHDHDEAGERTLRPWHREIRSITGGRGVDLYFDPVASGAYLSAEVRSLAVGGRIYLYGLLGDPGPVDLSPIIIRQASVVGWVMSELVEAGEAHWRPACQAILDRFADGTFNQHVAKAYPLVEVARDHNDMQRNEHVGKLVLVPGDKA